MAPVGVTLTYSILRFANFAHGEFVAWGAYFALAIAGALGAAFSGLLTPIGPFSFGWALPIAALVAIALNGGLALLVDALLFGRLRAQRSTIIIMVMASFGAALTLRSLLEFIFTSKPAYFTKALQIALPLGGGIRATPDQLLSLAVAAVLVVAVHLLLTRTAIGRSMRAVSENAQLAGVVGIEVRHVIRIVWLLGAGLACIAGISAGLLVQIRPQMGLDLLLPLFAAAILGGIGSVPGASNWRFFFLLLGSACACLAAGRRRCSSASSLLWRSLTSRLPSIIGFGSSPSRCGPSPAGVGHERDLPVPAQGASAHAGSLTTPGRSGARVARPPVSSAISTASAPGTSVPFAARWLAYALPYRRFATALTDVDAPARGGCGSLLLHRGGLAPPTPCRSPGAH